MPRPPHPNSVGARLRLLAPSLGLPPVSAAVAADPTRWPDQPWWQDHRALAAALATATPTEAEVQALLAHPVAAVRLVTVPRVVQAGPLLDLLRRPPLTLSMRQQATARLVALAGERDTVRRQLADSVATLPPSLLTVLATTGTPALVRIVLAHPALPASLALSALRTPGLTAEDRRPLHEHPDARIAWLAGGERAGSRDALLASAIAPGMSDDLHLFFLAEAAGAIDDLWRRLPTLPSSERNQVLLPLLGAPDRAVRERVARLLSPRTTRAGADPGGCR